MSAAVLKFGKHRIMGAPEVRVMRGDVALDRVAITDDHGKVIGQARAHRVQNRLDVLFKRKQINEAERDAGVRFARDVEACDVSMRSCMDLDSRGGGGVAGFINWAMVDAGAAAAMASIRVRDALGAIGLAGWPLVVWVAVQGRSAADWAEAQGRPRSEGMTMLRVGLQSLVIHYRACADLKSRVCK
jgi:hypothetical protein